jgi:hypothetical protein
MNGVAKYTTTEKSWRWMADSDANVAKDDVDGR